jgi:hypothetical protein
MLVRMGSRRSPHTLFMGIYISTASMEVPQKKVKLELLYDPAVPLLGVHSKECKSIYKGDSCISMFIATLFTIAKSWNLCTSIDKWVKKI